MVLIDLQSPYYENVISFLDNMLKLQKLLHFRKEVSPEKRKNIL